MTDTPRAARNEPTTNTPRHHPDHTAAKRRTDHTQTTDRPRLAHAAAQRRDDLAPLPPRLARRRRGRNRRARPDTTTTTRSSHDVRAPQAASGPKGRELF